jgi:hypothetical protein
MLDQVRRVNSSKCDVPVSEFDKKLPLRLDGLENPGLNLASYHTPLHTNKIAIERNTKYIWSQNRTAKLINILENLVVITATM